MRKAIEAAPSYTEAYSTLGKWLFDQHRFREAADVFLQAEKSCPNGSRIFTKATASALLYSGDYAQALSRIPANATDSTWKKLNIQARFMQSAVRRTKDTLFVAPVGIPKRINTSDPETFPFLSADGETFYFTRRVNGVDDDLYYAKRDTCGGWLGAKNMGSPPNSTGADAAPALSADRHYLFMMRCDNRSVNGWDQGGCDLFMAYTADSTWSVPLSFGATINTPAFEGMPSLSSDNRELFFVSDRSGGYGGLDIWSSRFEHGRWQLPQNLGPTVNTRGNEAAPYICADNETLFFVSDGHPGMGGSDIFKVKRINDTTWNTPLNAGWPINTPYDEVSVSLDAAADTIYFASDRDSLAQNFNLYQVATPPALRPGGVNYYSGYVYDSLHRNALNYASIYFTDNETGKELYQVMSNRGDGSYMIPLPAGHTYSILVSRIGYQQLTDTIRTADTVQATSARSFALLPADYVKPVSDTLVMTVFFKKNSTSLSDSDRVQLEHLLTPWLPAKDATIIINGYTDNSGTPLLNEQLSYTRARAVAVFVKGAGTPDERLQLQGWGEANPLAANDTEENRDKNRRVEIVIRR